jgi:hypothetical protein
MAAQPPLSTFCYSRGGATAPINFSLLCTPITRLIPLFNYFTEKNFQWLRRRTDLSRPVPSSFPFLFQSFLFYIHLFQSSTNKVKIWFLILHRQQTHFYIPFITRFSYLMNEVIHRRQRKINTVYYQFIKSCEQLDLNWKKSESRRHGCGVREMS